MTTIPSSPLPTVPAGVVPTASAAAIEQAAQITSPQPQAAAVPESDPVLNALQNLVAAESALAQSVNEALPSAAASQGGLSSLLADLVQAQQTQDLPPPVQAAIIDILALRSPLDAPITGADIKAALTNSGLFSEAKAAGLQAANAGAQASRAATDLKTSLLVLRQALTTWLSDTPAQPPAPTSGNDAPPAPARIPSGNLSPQTYRGVATGNAPPAPPAPMSAASSPAASPKDPAKPALAGSVPAQAQILSSPATVISTPQNLATRERAPVVPQPATTSSGPQTPKPTTNSKTILQQAVKASPVTVPAGTNGPAVAKSVASEPLRVPIANSPTPTTRAAPGPQASAAPASPPPSPAVPASPAPMPSVPVSTAMNPQATPAATETVTSLPQAQVTTASPAVNQAAQQAATPEPAANLPPPAPASTGALSAATDLKLALGLLQQLLKTSLDNLPGQAYAPEAARNPAPEQRQTAANTPPPPYRGGPTSAQPALPSTLPADANPRLAGQVLLNHTEAALAHLKLLQIASLPDAPQAGAHHVEQGPRWMFEIPFSTPQGSAVAQFEIRRDGRANTAEQSGPVWRARFSLDIEPMGPVHAQIVLMGGRAWITLWAEREASVQILRQNEKLLSQALKETDVDPEVAFCLGKPHRRVAPAGQFLDHAS